MHQATLSLEVSFCVKTNTNNDKMKYWSVLLSVWPCNGEFATSLRRQVSRLNWVEAALGESEDWVAFELQSKSERTVCLAPFWHSVLFRVQKTHDYCEMIGGKMVVFLSVCLFVCVSICPCVFPDGLSNVLYLF